VKNEKQKMKNDILKGENVRLRAVEPGDVDFIYEMENDPAIWHAGNTVTPFSRFQIEQYALTAQHNIYAEKQLRLMIELKESSHKNKTIGAIDLYDFDTIHKRAGVGILIVHDERGKGYASESLGVLIRYAFEILMLHQLFCFISPENIQSLHLFKRHGFVKCGTKKEWRLKNGKWTDEIMFQLINPKKY
jgi:diamine N-acetyltransferase